MATGEASRAAPRDDERRGYARLSELHASSEKEAMPPLDFQSSAGRQAGVTDRSRGGGPGRVWPQPWRIPPGEGDVDRAHHSSNVSSARVARSPRLRGHSPIELVVACVGAGPRAGAGAPHTPRPGTGLGTRTPRENLRTGLSIVPEPRSAGACARLVGGPLPERWGEGEQHAANLRRHSGNRAGAETRARGHWPHDARGDVEPWAPSAAYRVKPRARRLQSVRQARYRDARGRVACYASGQ